jgi:hypothetical protein
MLKSLINQFESHDRRIFWVLLGMLACAIFAYLYFLGSSISSVIMRKHAEMDISIAMSRISELETTYVELDKAITLSRAHADGFVDVVVPRYVALSPDRGTYTLRESSRD